MELDILPSGMDTMELDILPSGMDTMELGLQSIEEPTEASGIVFGTTRGSRTDPDKDFLLAFNAFLVRGEMRIIDCIMSPPPSGTLGARVCPAAKSLKSCIRSLRTAGECKGSHSLLPYGCVRVYSARQRPTYLTYPTYPTYQPVLLT